VETGEEPAEGGLEDGEASGEPASRTEDGEEDGGFVVLLALVAVVWYFVANGSDDGRSPRRRR
jgi:hypothetical protein